MDIIYLSPHLDDAALSCGGLIWEQVQAGHQVQIWTLCAGDPPGKSSDFVRQLHRRWGLPEGAVAQRRDEDIQACKILGVPFRHFTLPDCIYRLHPETGLPLYDSEEALFGSLADIDTSSMEYWVDKLAALMPEEPLLVCPLTVGGHVDHKMTRRIAERIPVELAYYADYPYIREAGIPSHLVPQEYRARKHAISVQALSIWQQSIACYASQISTFWPDHADMREDIRAYCEEHEGINIWRNSMEDTL